MAYAGSRSPDSGGVGDGRFPRQYPLPSPGDRFGRWTVLGVEFSEGLGLRGIKCRCECGLYDVVWFGNLRKGSSTQCRACARATAAETRTTEWARHIPDPKLRRMWQGRLSAAIARCEHPDNSQYRNYGGRGIRMHPEWVRDRASFAAYVVTLDGWDNPKLELDRVNNDQGYLPGNLRMATRSQQARNTRCYAGGKESVPCEWCGKVFQKRYKGSRFCSKPCSGRAGHNERRAKE
jgi:hypothetical protein